MSETTRIAMWSGPRNISTAMMYSFDSRLDCHATDEPLYASFLLSTGTPHPDANEVIEHHEADFDLIVSQLTGPVPDGMPIWYQKHMCHHIPKESDLSWIDGFRNCFLIRDPREVLLSLSKITDVVDLWVTGLPQQMRILEHVSAISNKTPPIVDSRDVLEDPKGLLSRLCESVGIPFTEEMMSWEPGPKECDGIWAKHWYRSVWGTSGFSPYRSREGELGGGLDTVLDDAMQIYNELWNRRIGS